jgi:hypothetical protein
MEEGLPLEARDRHEARVNAGGEEGRFNDETRKISARSGM